MDEIEQEIDLDQITDESLLQSLLDQTDDPEDRKVIRDRIKELRTIKKNEQVKQQEKISKLTNTREEMLQAKKKEAEQHKQKTATMYENMAKSAPAGAEKKLDTTILKPESKLNLPTSPPISTVSDFGPKYDHCEDAIKRRQREAEERKKKIMAAYDVAAKSAPAGAPRDIDFDVDVSQVESPKVDSGACFQMSGGVPVVKKLNSVPSTPILEKKPFDDLSHLDAMERALRERQRECEERKRRMLEQYNQASKQQAGPKVAAWAP